MMSVKLILLFVFVGCNLTVHGQFGFNRPFFSNGAEGGFTNQNTNFQQHRGGSFGVVAGFGTAGSSTNFNQQNSGAGFSNFGNSFGGFRNSPSNADENIEQNIVNHELRYASPYDEPEYHPPKPKYVPPPPPPAPAPAPYHASPMKCPENLLVGCVPQVQYVPCQPPPPSAGYPSHY